jgi:hypothetical protein
MSRNAPTLDLSDLLGADGTGGRRGRSRSFGVGDGYQILEDVAKLYLVWCIVQANVMHRNFTGSTLWEDWIYSFRWLGINMFTDRQLVSPGPAGFLLIAGTLGTLLFAVLRAKGQLAWSFLSSGWYQAVEDIAIVWLAWCIAQAMFTHQSYTATAAANSAMSGWKTLWSQPRGQVMILGGISFVVIAHVLRNGGKLWTR